MSLWIAFTLLAALAQNVRSMLQKQLTGALTVTGATYVRFLYGLPVAALYVAALLALDTGTMSSPPPAFYAYAAVGALAQIGGAQLLVGLYTLRHFSVGTAYSKSETIQAALLGLVLLGDQISMIGWLGIVVSVIGVLLLSMVGAGLTFIQSVRSLGAKPALMGLGVGLGFAIASVCYRAAAHTLPEAGFLLAAATTLLFVLSLQTLVMGGWIAARAPTQFIAALKAWPKASLVGLAGGVASIGWFTAFALENAAFVKAVGQIELLFALATAHFVFKERTTPRELAGIAALVGGIVLLLAVR